MASLDTEAETAGAGKAQNGTRSWTLRKVRVGVGVGLRLGLGFELGLGLGLPELAAL